MKERATIQIEYIPIEEIREYENNPRDNDKAVDAVARSMKRFGVRSPAIIDRDNVLIAGHTRIRAAKKLGMTEFPCVYASGLSEDEIRAYRLADNKTAELAGWDYDKLCEEITALSTDGFDLNFTGFNEAEQFYYLDDAATPDKPDKSEFREYQDEAEREVIQAYNVAIVCDGQRDKEYLMELIGEQKHLKRLYTGAEISFLLATKSA